MGDVQRLGRAQSASWLDAQVRIDGRSVADVRIDRRTPFGRLSGFEGGDVYLHGVAFEVEPTDAGWSVFVPDRGERKGNAREVQVRVDGFVLWRGRSSEAWTGALESAVVRVATPIRTYELDARWSGAAPLAHLATDTLDTSEMRILDLALRSHRAIAIACSARLGAVRARPLRTVEVATQMAGKADDPKFLQAVKALIRRGRESISDWVDIDSDGGLVSTDAAVDWLVSTGVVTSAVIAEAIARDRAEQTVPGEASYRAREA